MRSRFLSLFLVGVSAAAVAACGADDPASPTRLDGTEEQREAGGGRGDSTATPLTNPFSLRGTVYAVTVRVPATNGDSIVKTPLAGATVVLVRNVLVDGKATQVTAGTTTSAADGSFSFENLTGGYHVLTGRPPAGAALHEGLEYVASTASVVRRDLYLWAKRGG
ncbi:MAG TPA: hypothetical protein VEA99_02815 [Gemmatimonadaceae bacterium]|nr:hypothetical protein [Gemmatimonadaceae bacterium]